MNMKNFLIYSFSGELDDVSHLFPNDRLAQIYSLIQETGARVDILDRGNLVDIVALGAKTLAEIGVSREFSGMTSSLTGRS